MKYVALLKELKSFLRENNFLLIDEPTNHLDVEAKNALKDALLRYEGTMILVSHEKDFYEGLCDYELSLYNEEN